MIKALLSSLCKPDDSRYYRDDENNKCVKFEEIAIPTDGNLEVEKKVLGEGEFSVVKEAKCNKNGKIYAVKIVNKSKIRTDNRGMIMLINESQDTSKLDTSEHTKFTICN